MADNNKKWYVVRAVSGQRKVKPLKLKFQIRNEDYVSQVLVPTEKVVIVKREKIKDKSLFSWLCYDRS
jgi:transcriptional antiterminator NusG